MYLVWVHLVKERVLHSQQSRTAKDPVVLLMTRMWIAVSA